MNVGPNYSEAALHPEWATPKWYALFVRSNQEKRVVLHLQDRAVEYFLPAYESTRRWQDRKVKLLTPLFPGYVFVKLPFIERSRVVFIPNVVSLVGSRIAPSVITDDEIEWIRRGMEHGNAQPHPYLNIGSRVVIKAGAMVGMEGILIRAQNSTRVLISLNSIARTFVVEVDFDSVEAVTPGPAVQHLC